MNDTVAACWKIGPQYKYPWETRKRYSGILHWSADWNWYLLWYFNWLHTYWLRDSQLWSCKGIGFRYKSVGCFEDEIIKSAVSRWVSAVRGHKKRIVKTVQFRHSQRERLLVPWKLNRQSSNTFLLSVRKHQPHQRYAVTYRKEKQNDYFLILTQ